MFASLLCKAAASSDNPTGWMSGSLGFYGGLNGGAARNSSGRRLSSSSTRRTDGDSVDDERASAMRATQVALLSIFADRTISMFAIMGAVTFAQYAILIYWHLCANRRFYAL